MTAARITKTATHTITPVAKAAGTKADAPKPNTAYQEYVEAQQKLLRSLGTDKDGISFTRWVASHLTAIAVTAGLSTILTTGLDLATMAVLTYTGSAFAMMMVWIVGIVLAIYACLKAYGYVQEYIADKKIDVHYQLAKNWLGWKASQVGSLFTLAPNEVL